MRNTIHQATVLMAFAFAIPFTTAAAPTAGTTRSYDVVIAGAGTGGFGAAMQAARMGARVALLEETDWIGGQAAAAAVSTMDEGNNLTPPSGLYREFLSRMEAYYLARGKSVSTCYWSDHTHCFEPSAVRKVLTEMIAEVNANKQAKGRIDLLLQDRVARVLADGDTVTGVVTSRGETLHSKILIDATEYGDVIPLTPAQYRSGRSVGADNGKSCTQDITYAMIIKKYPGGVPAELSMKDPPPEYQKYLPALRRQWQINGNPVNRQLPVNFAIHNSYRGLPDSSNPENYVSTESRQITRTALNWFNDYPVNTTIYNRADRQKILCEAKLKTLANLYYLQHELKETLWSVANDEGYDTEYNRNENSCPNIPAEFKAIENHFPPAAYIRESNRLIGEHTLTAAEIRREKQGGISIIGFPDAIAVGDYADDLHGCNAPSDFNKDIESITNRPPGFRSGPFEVPLGSLIPDKVDGLLAAEKNISQTRLANGATRLQPITMLTGQAAGALGALAVAEHVQPRAVAADEVQIALLKAGSILARQPMPDLSMGTRPWQAAQYVVTHEWMTMGDADFRPSEVLTRGETADILDRAFALSGPAGQDDDANDMYGKSAFEAATYKDVPLYSLISRAVEAWHATGTVPPCKQSPEMFCPDAPMTTGELISAVAELMAKQPGARKPDIAVLREGVVGADNAPVTRVDAAMILYNSQPGASER